MGPKAIRMVRDALNETQGQFALRLGVSQATVSRWENGSLIIQGAEKILLGKILEEME
jgi:DNA-binding transcriptional regulator YiaG